MHRTYDEFDVVVVGSGLSGAWAAHELIECGLSVLMLEAGPALAPTPPQADPVTRVTDRQAIQSRHFSYWQHASSLFVDDVDHPYASSGSPYSWIRGRQAGGRSATWGGVALRFSDLEFRGPHAWPICGTDLAPYYGRIERLHRVEGFRDGLDELPDGEVTAPPSGGRTELELRFCDVIQSRWPTRRAINTRVIPSGDKDSGRWSNRSVLRSLLPKMTASGRLKILTDCIVSRLLVHRSGRCIEAVACLDRLTRSEFEIASKQVILCASTIETLRILLNSKSSKHPDGLGNHHGLLGQRLLDKAALSLSGDVPTSRHLPIRGFDGHGLLIPRFQHREPGGSGLGSYGVAGWMQRSADATTGAANWMLTAQIEVLPNPRNRIEIDTRLTDAWGIPSVRVTFDYSDFELESMSNAEHAMRQMASAAGYRINARNCASAGIYVHECGGAPMGRSPADSVLDRVNRVWGVDNLMVADGACFASSGWQNPSLTIMALAARAARLLAGRLL